MTKYQKLNNLFGWITFFIAASVYLLTIEPTASFWDCGEYIATAFKLEVGHPPGAPLFNMLGRFFSLFSMGDNSQAAKWINAMSALCSAFTILFLFWTITAFARKIAQQSGELTDGKIFTIIGSGLVGALAYTFSDSFWFSAVEGEVYAMSSFFTAIVFWAILKWESISHEPHANRWIIFIAYLMGLSIGVHLLNLLAIPAIVFIYYFKNYTATRKGMIYAGILSILILGGIQNGIVPGIVKLAASFELFFVNSIGLPFNAGIIIFGLLLIGGIIWGLLYTIRTNKPVWNTVILCFTMILIGYSSFMALVIRSKANPPLDENNPENAINLLSYLNREQYGDWPILYGPYFSAPYDSEDPADDGNPVYAKDEAKGKYVVIDDRKNTIPNYDKKFCTIFPRMWSQQSNHVAAYKDWGNVKGERIQVRTGNETETIIKPSFFENLTYFFRYQVGHMYMRYFFWNFVGKQNDVQGHGNTMDGNWITGISFIDEMRLGPQDTVPSSYEGNKANNKLYGLPLILGLIGLFFHFNRNNKDAFVVALLFFFTGLAIVIYLNQYPYQPRERDYAYAASFYAFAIWIGLGVMAVVDYFKNKLSEKTAAIAATLVCLLAVPGVMAKEEWNDHDRSNRYAARDFAINYLQSCAPNAIIFTNGDNDTFPLWYVQEVEGIRTDVRVVNLSLLNTDWYIDQMKKKAYDSDPVPFSLKHEQYRQGTRDRIYFYDRKIQGHIKLREFIDFIGGEGGDNKLQYQDGQELYYYPTKNLSIPVNKEIIIQNKMVSPKLYDKIVPSIDWQISKSYLDKNDLMVLDLLATNNWERPVYFAVTTGSESYMNLEEYFQLEGLAYRLVPVKSSEADAPQGMRVATDEMYDNVMNKFKWGNMNAPGVYLDEQIIHMTTNLRIQMGTLASQLVTEGKKDSAIKVLNRCLEVMPEVNVPYDASMFSVTVAYYQAGAVDQPNKIAKRLFDNYEHDLKYYFSLKPKFSAQFARDVRQAQDILQKLVYVTQSFKQDALAKEFETRLNTLQSTYGAKFSQ